VATLPKVSFCNHQISKLIIGDNPIYGYSHFNQLLSQHQQEYHTPERVVATLKRAEEAGLNAWQNSLTERSLSDLQRYRDEGGTLNWFCLSPGGLWYEEPDAVFEAAKHDPFGMAPHGGGVGHRCLRENRLDHLQDILKRVRDTGALVGLSVHDPKLLHIAEDEDWDIDYYMTGLYTLHGVLTSSGRNSATRPWGKSTPARIATKCAKQYNGLKSRALFLKCLPRVGPSETRIRFGKR